MQRLQLRFRNLFVLVFFLGAVALAQRDLGTITGIITDPQGAAITGAKITITEDATGLTYDVLSSGAGEYIRPLLKPGTYTVTAEAPGFRHVSTTYVVIAAAS